MERGRILILGGSKESTYELRSLLDNQRFELEIALSSDVGKSVLSARLMSLIMVHTEMLQQDNLEFVEFLKSRAARVPMAIFGDEAETVGQTFVKGGRTMGSDLKCFDKPYASEDLISFIEGL